MTASAMYWTGLGTCQRTMSQAATTMTGSSST